MRADVETLLEKLSPEEKQALIDRLEQDLFKSSATNGTSVKRVRGWAKGAFSVPDDFDEPLEDFKEYM